MENGRSDAWFWGLVFLLELPFLALAVVAVLDPILATK